MSSDVEPAKKILLPYLQRADELQKHEPLVAYYCRLYGMERGLKIPPKERTKTTNAILVSLMNQLEKDKRTVKVSPDDNLYVEGFALSVFAKADKQDRVGRADLNTAKTFYAASIFIEILRQFGPLQPDIEQKQKYAAWKAADIRKALSEGRKPVPGPPGGDEDFLASPRKSIDSVEDKHSMHHSPPSERSTNEGPMLDGGSKAAPSQPPEYEHHDLYVDHAMPQQPPTNFAHPGRTQSGYAAAYSGMHHPASLPDPTGASSSFAASPYGSIDQYNAQIGHGYYHGYTQPKASEDSYSRAPTVVYPGSNGGSKETYYLSQGPDPNAVSYPASAPFSADYSSFAGPSNLTGLGQTTSAPILEAPSHTSAPFSADYSSFAGPSNPAGSGQTTSAPILEAPSHTYHPTPDKISEAQKAAKFAVSALAFDDVPTAVSYLRQSLELLTNRPS